MCEFFTMGVFAKRRSGKTHAIREILFRLKKRFTDVYLFSATVDLQDDVYEFVPKSNRSNFLDIKKIQSIVDEQRHALMKQKGVKGKKKQMRNPLLIFDDIIGEAGIRKAPEFSDLFIKGRHSHVSIIVLSQTFSSLDGIPKSARLNLDYACAFFIDAEYDRKQFIERFCSKQGKKEGEEFFKQITSEQYCCVIVDNVNTTARKCEDYIFKFKAKPKCPKFQIGHQNDRQPLDNAHSLEGAGRLNKFQLNLRFAMDDDGGGGLITPD